MQAFENVTVLDLTHVLAGPFATYQLAVLGANVIKIESPKCFDMARSDGANLDEVGVGMGVEYQAQNANKRSLLLDLSTPDGQDVLKRMSIAADVLVENYAAGTLDRFGLGAKHLMALNPRLVYCSITGFGQSGAKRGHPAYDNVIQAYSGLMHATGTSQSGPIKVGPPVLDYITGAQAAFGIATALFQRERSGRGQRIDVAMLDAAIVSMSAAVMGVLETQEPPQRLGNASPSPGYAAYETSDGLLMVGAYNAAQHERLYTVLGLDDLAADVKGGTVADMARRSSDVERIAAIMITRSADTWEKILTEAHVPAARVRSLDEALGSLNALERRVLQSPQNDADTRRRFPVAAFHFADNGPIVRTAPPRPGQHSINILQEFGFSRDVIAALTARGVVG
jgi:crotonobetainyl-CoA:carnitine CoA-transferase CaiB-like acyl-CoA transferase